jgi:3-dehydroquinate synthase
MKLNLGHTIGHGVEAQSHFGISHGKAVAIGMAIVSRAAAANGFCTNETKDEILSVLERFGLPITTAYSAGQLYTSALSDKKRSGGTVNLIVPEAIGSCAIVPTAITDLESFIQAGL